MRHLIVPITYIDGYDILNTVKKIKNQISSATKPLSHKDAQSKKSDILDLVKLRVFVTLWGKNIKDYCFISLLILMAE
jgi:hypothetical protein